MDTSPSVLRDPVLASRVGLRRAIALAVMTLFLPGSAQIAAGNRRLGWIALRTWGALWAVLVIVGVAAALDHSVVLRLGTDTTILLVLKIILWAVAAGWTLLFLDAWRLGTVGGPAVLSPRHRLTASGVHGVVCFGVAGTLLFASHLVTVQRDLIQVMFSDGKATEATDGRYNVLLLGGDSGKSRWGLRTDSMTVASIDASTGRTVLFGLPRNMTNFPFPKGSVMRKYWPRGYNCDDCELNSLATWAAEHPEAFKGVDNPQVEATIQGIEGITGLTINYWAMVNLQGFRHLVDAVGGLTLNVRDRIPIGGGGNVIGWVEPGVRKLDGYQTLWFARSRQSADDYSRMARQKCVMNAMLQQLSPQTVLLKFEKIAAASETLITTDLPRSELARFAELALKARGQKVSTVSFVPPAIVTADPDIRKIRRMVETAIAKAEGSAAAEQAGAGFTRKNKKASTGGSIGNISDGYAANSTSDLSKAC